MKKDQWIAIGTVGTAAAALWDLGRTEARRFGMASLSSTDFPTAVAWVLLGLGALLFAATWFARAVPAAAAPSGTDTAGAGGAPPARLWRRSWALLLVTVVYIVVMPTIGFYLSTAVYLVVMVYAGASGSTRRRAMTTAVIAMVSVGIIYFLFNVWLRFFLPRGVLW